MFDIAWTEMLVIGAVALVVIGPKDLPRVLKTVGAMVNKARGMAREFQSGIDDMIRESELEELRKAAKLDIGAEANKIFVDPMEEAQKTPPVTADALTGIPAEAPPAAPVALPGSGESFVPPEAASDEVAAAEPQPPKPAP